MPHLDDLFFKESHTEREVEVVKKRPKNSSVETLHFEREQQASRAKSEIDDNRISLGS